MLYKATALLDNHPVEEHNNILAKSAHILFHVDHGIHRRCKWKHDREALRQVIRTVNLSGRLTHRHLAAKLGLSLSTTYHLTRPRPLKRTEMQDRMIEEGLILRKHSNPLKPVLDEAQKYCRFLFCRYSAGPLLNIREPVWSGQYNRVFVDEKWFWISKDNARYLLLADEELPTRRVRHKKYMTKVMFLCAQARPRWDYHKHWDGKLGMWPVGRYDRARRSSVNRPAGTRVWVDETMDSTKYKEMMMDCVVPAILERWPIGDLNDPRYHNVIQQDGAGGHCSTTDPFLLNTLRELEKQGLV